MKIFIVDEDLQSLNFYRGVLEKSGFHSISLFLNGTICLNNLHQSPKVIILNQNLGSGKGFDLLKKIKRKDSGIYVILIGNEENTNDASESLKYGAFDSILKEDFQQKVIAILNRIESIKTPDEPKSGFMKKLLSLL